MRHVSFVLSSYAPAEHNARDDTMNHLVQLHPNDNTIETDRLDAALHAASTHVRREQDRWHFSNPDTRVRFSLRLEPAEPLVLCEVPCPRPRFFLEEATTLLRSLCATLPMRIVEPVAWERSQASAIESLASEGPPLPRWDSSAADAWWRYARQRSALLTRYDAQGVFAPQVFLFADTRGRPQVRTAFAWCDAQATLLPPCDLVMILDRTQEPTPWGQDTRLRGFVTREHLVHALADHLDAQMSHAIPFDVLGAKATPAVRKVFRELSAEPPPSSEEFRGISADTPLDVSEFSE